MTTHHFLVAAVLAVGCGRDADDSPHTHAVDPGSTAKGSVTQAIAVLHTPMGMPVGNVRFAVVGDDLDVVTTIDRLPPGKHAYHVHVFGDCSSFDLESAGPHFHFTGSSFDKSVKHITGNLGDLMPDATGRASHRARLESAALHGKYSLLGRSVIVHDKPNNPAVTPDGGAGPRLACGVIGVANTP